MCIDKFISSYVLKYIISKKVYYLTHLYPRKYIKNPLKYNFEYVPGRM